MSGDEDWADGFIRDTYERMKQSSVNLPWTSRKGPKKKTTDAGSNDVDRSAEEEGWTPPPGIARSLSGTGKSRRDPQSLDSILRRTTARKRWKAPLSMGTIAAAWPEIVGIAIAGHSEVEALDDHRLLIRTDSTAWAKQLQLLVPQIEKRIDDVVGTGAVTQVIVHGPQRPSWKHGRKSVPGRGPRDTYG